MSLACSVSTCRYATICDDTGNKYSNSEAGDDRGQACPAATADNHRRRKQFMSHV